MSESPQFLIERPSPWREFWSSVGPALRPSPPRLRMEARAGLFPGRGMLLTLLLEVAALAGVIAAPTSVSPVQLTKAEPASHDVIFFSADELPRTEDLAGAAAGRHGTSGGASLPHPSQTIKVSRDQKLSSKVIDAPTIPLPKSDSQVSNLLAYKAVVPIAPPNPIVVRADQRQVEEQTTSPRVSLPRDAMPKLPQSNVVPVAPPTPIMVSREHATTEPTQVRAPSVKLARDQMPALPQANITIKAPPTPIQVARSRERSKLELDSPVSVPKVAMTREQMPSLPQANVTVKAPPTPIQVARSRQRTASESGTPVAAPRIGAIASSRREELASLVSAPNVSLPAAPPKPATTGNSKVEGVLLSPNPGSQAAVPKNQEKATVAMDRTGTSSAGLGSTGGGTGMSSGKGPGSSLSAAGTGTTASGKDKGADYYARNGNSPNVGPGGTGNLSVGTPRAPGVSVSGGNSITLPSFGGPPQSANAGRSEIAKNMGTGITVIASPRAGGALNLYGALKGDRVYTIYINTRIGTAVMQFADPNSVSREYATVLTAPRVLHAEVADEPESGTRPKVLIGCELDEQGIVRKAHVLQSESNDFATKMLAALPSWKFTPAFRGNQAVAVNAILGFGVDTK